MSIKFMRHCFRLGFMQNNYNNVTFSHVDQKNFTLSKLRVLSTSKCPMKPLSCVSFTRCFLCDPYGLQSFFLNKYPLDT